MAKPNPFEKDKKEDADSKSKGKEEDQGPPGKGGDDDWQDGADFDGSEGKPGEEAGEGEDGAIGDGEPDQEGSIRGHGGNDKPAGKGKVHMRVEAHESGDGHRVHFHDDVNADVCGDADYQHHVTEHSKHYAGHLIHKESDPDRAEAHRHAANLHARIGNALHAGGDTEPRKGQIDPMEAMGLGPEGIPGEENDDGEFPVGFGSEEWNDGDDATFPDQAEPSPGEDLAGGEVPAKPDKIRNNPGRDSRIEAMRKKGGQTPPKLVFGKAELGGDLRKSKFLRKYRGASGKWVYVYKAKQHRAPHAPKGKHLEIHNIHHKDVKVGDFIPDEYDGYAGGSKIDKIKREGDDTYLTLDNGDNRSWHGDQPNMTIQVLEQRTGDHKPMEHEKDVQYTHNDAGWQGGVKKSLSKGGGPFIGPKGGKWADAKHTIPWKEGKTKKSKAPKKLPARAAKGLHAAIDGVVPDGPRASSATVRSLTKKGLVEYGGHGSYILTTKGRAVLEEHLLAENIERGMWGKVPRKHWPQEMKDKWGKVPRKHWPQEMKDKWKSQTFTMEKSDVKIGYTW